MLDVYPGKPQTVKLPLPRGAWSCTGLLSHGTNQLRGRGVRAPAAAAAEPCPTDGAPPHGPGTGLRPRGGESPRAPWAALGPRGAPPLGPSVPPGPAQPRPRPRPGGSYCPGSAPGTSPPPSWAPHTAASGGERTRAGPGSGAARPRSRFRPPVLALPPRSRRHFGLRGAAPGGPCGGR